MCKQLESAVSWKVFVQSNFDEGVDLGIQLRHSYKAQNPMQRLRKFFVSLEKTKLNF